MSQLEELFTRFGTDKGTWGYTPAYEAHLDRSKVKNVLEIGICGFRDIPGNVVGASLFAWRDYFPSATIYGVDNDTRFIFNDQARICTALCDAYDPTALVQALIGMCAPLPRFDFICDDAVHDPLPQINLCATLWPLLNTGGVYAIEEACGYKCMNGDIRHLIRPLITMFPEMLVTEYQTHKDERLLILRKSA